MKRAPEAETPSILEALVPDLLCSVLVHCELSMALLCVSKRWTALLDMCSHPHVQQWAQEWKGASAFFKVLCAGYSSESEALNAIRHSQDFYELACCMWLMYWPGVPLPSWIWFGEKRLHNALSNVPYSEARVSHLYRLVARPQQASLLQHSDQFRHVLMRKSGKKVRRDTRVDYLSLTDGTELSWHMMITLANPVAREHSCVLSLEKDVSVGEMFYFISEYEPDHLCEIINTLREDSLRLSDTLKMQFFKMPVKLGLSLKRLK